MMEELDVSGDQFISEEEFVTGLSKWLNTIRNTHHNSEEAEEDSYQVRQILLTLLLAEIVIL